MPPVVIKTSFPEPVVISMNDWAGDELTVSTTEACVVAVTAVSSAFDSWMHVSVVMLGKSTPIRSDEVLLAVSGMSEERDPDAPTE